jgi:pSer/pThr/pTyr-binding forkhead associated (FHA) protein
MKALLVGRASDCDIMLSDPTVSRRHADLIPGSGSDFLLVDRKSTSGTFLRHKGAWRRVTMVRVVPEDRVRLGDHETSIGQLIAMAAQADNRGGRSADLPTADRAGRARPERNPETGEIVVPRKRDAD